MSDGRYYAIKGFELTILELFKADDSTSICLEQFQDTLLPKLMGGKVWVEYNENGVSYHGK